MNCYPKKSVFNPIVDFQLHLRLIFHRRPQSAVQNLGVACLPTRPTAHAAAALDLCHGFKNPENFLGVRSCRIFEFQTEVGMDEQRDLVELWIFNCTKRSCSLILNFENRTMLD